ncbi:MAG: hypothetical protein GFH23_1086718n38 [Chloroflexi bacterium AL-N1]|nr:hypothetical protein [Chloroflexi bacterium AL-N1]NOK77307.1 hypothetical protein [Chloroflexi bacterium AL-N5]
MTEQTKPTTVEQPDEHIFVLTSELLTERIEARLAGQIDDASLSSWAFDRFYAEEVGAEDYEEGREPLIADVLDVLMFGDDPSFCLSETELHDLVKRLNMA